MTTVRGNGFVMNYERTVKDTALPAIAKDYAPYDQLPAFREGFEAYGKTWTNPHDGVAAQAWDRGLECAARARRIDRMGGLS